MKLAASSQFEKVSCPSTLAIYSMEKIDSAASISTDYVLVIHGTWNKPEAGVVKWYQLHDRESNESQKQENFCERLNDLLEVTPLGRAVWRSCALDKTFSWSGGNDHSERLRAAEKLCQEFIALTDRDPTARIHVIAHSHGGNVLLKALELYLQAIIKAREADCKTIYRLLVS